MFKEVFNTTSADQWSSYALVIFVAVFAGVCLWALTRRKTTVDRWSHLPLEDHDAPPPPSEEERAKTPQR